jgi:hypothetical protein
VKLKRLFEYAFLAFMAVAVLGETRDFTLALGVLLPAWWLHEKNREIDDHADRPSD